MEMKAGTLPLTGAIGFALSLAASVSAQDSRAAPAPLAPVTQPAAGASQTTSDAPATVSNRWVEAQTASLDLRYRLIESSDGMNTSNHLQHRQTVRGAFKLDAQGRYGIRGMAGTGSSFTGSWDDTGVGTGEPDWSFAVRQLYASARPIEGLEVQAGGLGLSRGENTEITSFDNDGFIVGERVSVKRPRELLFDEISVTAGYLGDLNRPNVFRRFDRMDDHNYTQVLLARKFANRLAASIDWTSLDGIDTWREGIRVEVREARVIDSVRLELYQRVQGMEDTGFAATLEKAVATGVNVGVGYADIDREYGTLNGDRFGPGRRLFLDARVALPAALSLNVFVQRAVNNDFDLPNRTRLDIALSYDVLRALKRD